MPSRDPTGLDAPPPSRRLKVAALLAVLVLVGVVVWVGEAILTHNRVQNCIDSGRRDCIPVETRTRP